MSRIKGSSGVISTIGSVLSSVAVAFCPVCIPAIAAFMGSIGLGFFVSDSTMMWVLILFLMIYLLGLIWSFKKEHQKMGPLAVGFLMALTLFSSRHVPISFEINKVLMYLGITGVISTSLWNLYLRKKYGCQVCKVS